MPADHPATDEALLDVLIRNVWARQSMVRSVLEAEDEVTPLSFVGSMTMADGVPAVVASIREVLDIDLEDFRAQRSVDAAFAFLREGVEEGGVFVLLIGDLGSYHTAIDLKTFRGFSLADDLAPFVVINPHDARSAWAFTLLHELTHLWLGQTGVSGGGRSELAIEQFCNDVASNYLLPQEDLLALQVETGVGLVALGERITAFARRHNVSSSMVAYRLYRSSRIESGLWQQLRTEFRRRWLEHRESRRARARDQDGGPNFYVLRRHRTGPALVHLVERLMNAGDLTTSKAGTVLDVKPMQVASLLAGTPSGRARGQR